MKSKLILTMVALALTGAWLTSAAPASAASSRSVLCGFSFKRVQVIYAVAPDRPNRYSTMKSGIQTVVHDMDTKVFDASAHETGGHRHLSFTWSYTYTPWGRECEPTVSSVVFKRNTDDDSFDAIVAALKNDFGYTSVDRKYLVFVDAPRTSAQGVFCIGNRPIDDRKVSTNAANSGPHFAVVGPSKLSDGSAGGVNTGCWHARGAAHELMHTLGGVQSSAPHGKNGHTTQRYDRMGYSLASSDYVYVAGCSDVNKWDWLFDCGHDDYFFAGKPPAGNYLATHWNTADSAYLLTTE